MNKVVELINLLAERFNLSTGEITRLTGFGENTLSNYLKSGVIENRSNRHILFLMQSPKSIRLLLDKCNTIPDYRKSVILNYVSKYEMSIRSIINDLYYKIEL